MRYHDLTPHLADPNALTLYPGNPNHGDEDAIRDSIETNGFYEPVAVQQSTGYIVSGNHRVKVARELGLTEVPVVYLDIDDTEARRILLSANNTVRRGVTDDLALGRILALIAQDEAEAHIGTGLDREEAEEYLLMVEHSDAEAARYAASADVPEDPKPTRGGGGFARPAAAPVATPGIRVPGEDDPDYGKATSTSTPHPTNSARRVMVLDLPLDVFAWLSDRLTELRTDYRVNTDAKAILHAVADATGTEPPALRGPEYSDPETDGTPLTEQDPT